MDTAACLFYAANATFGRPQSGTDVGANIKNLILCVLAGYAVALIITYYCKVVAGKAVRLMLEAGAFSEETAKTLAELGIKNERYHARVLERSAPQKVICRKTEDGRYYIAEEMRSRAERTYTQKENALGMTVVSLILTGIMFTGVYFFSDALIEKFNALVDSLSSTSEPGGTKTDDGGFVYETDEMGHVKDGSEPVEDEDEEEDGGEEDAGHDNDNPEDGQ